MEQRDCLWWQHGYHNWTNEESKRRLRVNRDTLNFILNAIEEDNVQMPLKLVKELLKQQESTLKVFLSAYMDSVNTRIDNLMKDVQSVKSSLEFTQAQVEELITSDLRLKEVKVQIEDLQSWTK